MRRRRTLRRRCWVEYCSSRRPASALRQRSCSTLSNTANHAAALTPSTVSFAGASCAHDSPPALSCADGTCVCVCVCVEGG